jgi:hypothetical protein
MLRSLLLALAAAAAPASAAIDPAALQAAGRVDPRFLSYNVEMVEVTGGRFWKPYRLGPPKDADDRYAYRPPMNLASPRLRTLAAALGPAYIRVSGTWANTTFVAPRDGMASPKGFAQVLTPAQLRELAAFSRAVGGQLVLSAPVSAGARDANGAWQPAQLEALLRGAQASGATVAGVAFMNEPNIIRLTGAPANYSAADYARDYAAFAAAVRRAAPGALVLNPDAVGGADLAAFSAATGVRLLDSADLAAARPAADVYAYHHYSAVSQRCATTGPLATKQADARDPAWLARTDATLRHHAAIRDAKTPGAPIWLTETAQAACGGSPWAATFVDVPRFVDQLGRLARQSVAAVFHNTLAASDYGMLDEESFAPRPNYWAALLWARLMGETVLAVDVPAEAALRTYAHCLKGVPGGVALAAVNLGDAPARVEFNGSGRAFAMSANGDGAGLNGRPLRLAPRDRLPPMAGVVARGGASVAAGGVTFVSLPGAGAAACR